MLFRKNNCVYSKAGQQKPEKYSKMKVAYLPEKIQRMPSTFIIRKKIEAPVRFDAGIRR